MTVVHQALILGGIVLFVMLIGQLPIVSQPGG